MFPAAAPSVYQSPKCFMTHGTMGHVDTKQAPRKGKPWAAITSLDFIHKVDLILPAEVHDAVSEQLAKTEGPPLYSRVVMSVGDILQGDFFTEYIKKGDIIMLSEGRMTVGTLFTLCEGVLTIDPSMLRGKKGFDRLIYACKNVFNQPMAWLFCDKMTKILSPDPLQQFFPTAFTSTPVISQDLAVVQPSLDVGPEILAENNREALEYFATETYEWLSLIRLASPRVRTQDSIDPYLSRYCVPGDTAKESTVCRISWEGFLSTEWLHGLLMDALAACPSGAWFSLSATCFSKGVPGTSDELTILRPPNAAGRYLMWEIKA
ncbi:ribonuclease p/mrp protein subunit pop1 [Fusarium sporotrichioides]|uniref:Ribonuclease p/mrp protein subunit pop1 n=1 Tax=Fusarium sporotrichioides TaxID=5514 RepID=A0A395RJP8_FUSSP|nr:ribonuclease p/mrp protein subunit pop1 [Fusarium sporotrichioides]